MDLEIPPAWPPAYPRHRPVSAREAGDLDRRATAEFGIPSLVLMEHASLGIAGLAAALAGPEGRILCLCGPGNNGGDGYGAGRFLHAWGREPIVLRCAPRAPDGGDAGLQYELCSASAPILDAWAHPDRVGRALAQGPTVIVDALFGVGLARPLEDPFLGWVREINAAPGVRLAVDVPSGMETDTGEALPECVQAHVTAAMAAPKRGFLENPGPVGRVVEVDIGLPAALHADLRA